MRIETVHPKEIGPSEAALWRAHQGASEGLGSPYFTPDWAQSIGAARTDARVCVIDGGQGFFAAQRLSRFSAMGLGAPIADYQGVVAAPGLALDPAQLCAALKVGRIDLTHVPPGNAALAQGAAGAEGSWIAETSGARELYEAALRLRRAEFVRQTDKKARKLGRDHGEARFSANVGDADILATMLQWKNTQLIQSRQPAIWDTPWVRAVLEQSFSRRGDASFGGVLFALHAGERLAACAYALRAGRVMHLWILAHDRAFDTYSPGVQLTRWLIGWAAEHGVAEVDFGPGDYQYKRQLSTTQRMLSWGAATRLSMSGATRQAAFALRAGVERLPQPKLAALPGKAMRKLDLIRALA